MYSNYSLLGTEGLDGNGYLTAAQLRSVLETYREAMRAQGEDAMQQIYSGTFYFRLDDDYFEFPLYDVYDEVADVIRNAFSDAVLEYTDFTYEKKFVRAEVYYRGTVIGTMTEDELTAYINEGIISGQYSSYDTPLTLVTPDYSIEVQYRVTETEKHTFYPEVSIYYDEEGVEHDLDPKPTSDITTNEYDEHVSASFFWDCVPAKYQK